MNSIDKVEQEIEELKDDFCNMWRDEAHSHQITKIFKNIFLVWAVVATMLAIFMIYYMAGFTYVDPEDVSKEEIYTITQDGEGINNINTGSQGDVINGANINQKDGN